jgi:hypothetical protein
MTPTRPKKNEIQRKSAPCFLRSLSLIAIMTMLVLTGCAQPLAPVTSSRPTSSPPTAAPTSPPPTPAPCTEPIGPVGCLTTVAGGGRELKDGGQATSAALCEPSDVAVDAAGNLYIANAGVHCSGPAANRVVKVDPQGILTIFAGTGEASFSGDGGPAASARLLHPVWVAVDRAGNVYIADTSNYRIRKVDTTGSSPPSRARARPDSPGMEAQRRRPSCSLADKQIGAISLAAWTLTPRATSTWPT